MKILHIIDSGGLYGAEVMLLDLMREQVALGLEPILASIGDPGIAEKPLETEAVKQGLPVQVFRMRPGPNVLGALNLLRFARKEQVDLLHSHGYKGNILFGLMPRLLRRLPMVATIHGWTWTGGLNRMGLYEWLDGVSLRYLDRVILVNEAMKEHPRLKNRPALAFEVVNNGISDEVRPDNSYETDGCSQKILDFCRQGYTIGAVGRFSPEKGFELLLEAVAGLVAENEDIQLLLLGEGGGRERLEGKVRELDLKDRVYMPGYVNNARKYLPFLQIFALPSLTEGLPIVLLEAMMAGVPIVASRVGGIPNVLAAGRAGRLIEAGNVEALIQAIAETMQKSENVAQRIAEARRRVCEEYSSRIMAEKYREIYQRVLS